MRKKHSSHFRVSVGNFLLLASVSIIVIFCSSFITSDKNPILIQKQLNPNRVDPIKCASHADLVQPKEGDWCAVFLACKPISRQYENPGRETLMIPVKWSGDFFCYAKQSEDLIPMVMQRNGTERHPKMN